MRSQFVGLYVREVARIYRNPLFLLMTVIQPFMWLIFFGSSFAELPASQLEALFHTNSYIAFLLPGTLSTSMLTVGMFSSMSAIMDKRMGYMKRILLTPTPKWLVFLTKALGATTRGLVQIPLMLVAAFAFGVHLPWNPVDWAAFVGALFCVGLGFSSMFMAITAASTDWQTPGAISNFITMPLMFSSAALFTSSFFPWWMQDISAVNPISFSALFGRSFLLTGTPTWGYLGYLVVFAAVMTTIGGLVSQRWLKVE